MSEVSEKTKQALAATTSKYLTTSEAAVLLRTSPAAVRVMLYRGQLPRELVIRPNGGARTKILFVRAALERHLSSKAGAL